ncbi:MAG: DUF4192 family protein [Leucobacter sp.]
MNDSSPSFPARSDAPAPDVDPPRVVRCRTTADFLAALPQLTGFTATDSVFLVFFSGSRTGQAMRMDLPPSEKPSDSAGLLDAMCSILRSLERNGEGISDPAIVITCARTFADAGGPPWRDFARRLERRLRREGIRPRELACLAPDGWISFLDPAAPCGGRPLSEIEESPIALDARLRGENPPDLSRLGEIPEPDPALAAAVAAELDALPPFDFTGSGSAAPSGAEPVKTPSAPGEPVTTRRQFLAEMAERVTGAPSERAHAWMHDTAEICRALRDDRAEFDPRMAARLIRCAERSDRWLFLALGILTRPEFPVELARDMGPAQFVAVPVDLDTDPGAPARPGWSIRRILLSISPDFTDRKRLPPIRRRLLAVLSATPETERPGLLSLSAWLWWLSGSQTVAHRQTREALAIDPDHELAQMVDRLSACPLYAGREVLAAPGTEPPADARVA